MNGSLKFDPKIEEKKNPDSNTTPLLLKCANTTQHRQAASARNTIECRKTLAEAKPENTRNPKAKRVETRQNENRPKREG